MSDKIPSAGLIHIRTLSSDLETDSLMLKTSEILFNLILRLGDVKPRHCLTRFKMASAKKMMIRHSLVKAPHPDDAPIGSTTEDAGESGTVCHEAGPKRLVQI